MRTCWGPFGIPRPLVPPPCLHGFCEVLASTFRLRPSDGSCLPPADVKDQLTRIIPYRPCALQGQFQTLESVSSASHNDYSFRVHIKEHARAYYIGADIAAWAKKHARKPKKVSMDGNPSMHWMHTRLCIGCTRQLPSIEVRTSIGCTSACESD